eukprot:TRINITY_DN39881_c0_g1_i3.p1 TRINITY_DN39881_c0_g1~~TRINITY_DN39881_c0_g1_i3.p1  ORF type:complete len:166 (+),score=22.80 TRINITY_DN39881_c0_g1_i3:415-912(+)
MISILSDDFAIDKTIRCNFFHPISHSLWFFLTSLYGQLMTKVSTSPICHNLKPQDACIAECSTVNFGHSNGFASASQVRQITITIRTIINGICYLATFVFGINAVGLVLYSGQLAINSFMEPFSSDSTSSKEDEQQKTSSPSIEDPSDNMESKSDDGQNNTNESQ